MKIKSLDHASVNVSDVAASKKFYGDMLGLTEMYRPDFDFDGAWYLIGETQQIHLIAQDDLAPAGVRQNHHFALEVEDLDATRKELEGRGVEIMLQNDRPDGVHQMFVKDPDGYVIEFTNAGDAPWRA